MLVAKKKSRTTSTHLIFFLKKKKGRKEGKKEKEEKEKEETILDSIISPNSTFQEGSMYVCMYACTVHTFPAGRDVVDSSSSSFGLLRAK